jgi:hypothetical protein
VRQTEAGHASYCCSGCALASRLPPVDSNGQFPVTPALIVALGVGFAFFNEVLFWALGLLLMRDHRAETALQFTCVSAGLGVMVWAAAVASIWRAPARRWTDAVVALATLGVIAAAMQPRLAAGCVVAANTALGLWLARGWGKLKFIRKKPLTV